MIRLYERKDYESVKALLKSVDLSVPTPEEMEGYGLVWETEESPTSIAGFVWALMGNGKAAYIDYLCVGRTYLNKKIEDRRVIAISLLIKLFKDLNDFGITRIITTLQNSSVGESLKRVCNSVGMNFSEPLALTWGNPSDVLVRLSNLKLELKDVWIKNNRNDDNTASVS